MRAGRVDPARFHVHGSLSGMGVAKSGSPVRRERVQVAAHSVLCAVCVVYMPPAMPPPPARGVIAAGTRACVCARRVLFMMMPYSHVCAAVFRRSALCSASSQLLQCLVSYVCVRPFKQLNKSCLRTACACVYGQYMPRFA